MRLAVNVALKIAVSIHDFAAAGLHPEGVGGQDSATGRWSFYDLLVTINILLNYC
jgi:hypothetical protein